MKRRKCVICHISYVPRSGSQKVCQKKKCLEKNFQNVQKKYESQEFVRDRRNAYHKKYYPTPQNQKTIKKYKDKHHDKINLYSQVYQAGRISVTSGLSQREIKQKYLSQPIIIQNRLLFEMGANSALRFTLRRLEKKMLSIGVLARGAVVSTATSSSSLGMKR